MKPRYRQKTNKDEITAYAFSPSSACVSDLLLVYLRSKWRHYYHSVHVHSCQYTVYVVITSNVLPLQVRVSYRTAVQQAKHCVV